MIAAVGWGALAASSLVLGALLALGGSWSDRSVGLVLSFGAGALISAVSFDLAEEGIDIGGLGWVALGWGEAMADLKKATTKGGMLYVFSLP